ncbi:hypothetical protein D9V86_08270 [Bacteroidetes/Chlorobi group bacterium ChocPot_Mid]|jgi:uncharacterized protein YgiM (DUF1202 family)|nr:MAG: hypothetical protein D9V86_08270 [Bacteroidetes/Chlorobi group bacterium ChocPot_Mid]
MNENKVKNVIVNTHKNVRYIIWADRKLSREEMLKQVRYYNYNTLNIRPKMDSEIELNYDEEK